MLYLDPIPKYPDIKVVSVTCEQDQLAHYSTGPLAFPLVTNLAS